MRNRDYGLFLQGLKKQEDTWWGKAIEHNADKVRKGEYGELIKEWKDKSGWGDGVYLPHFIVFKAGYPILLKATESGVFRKLHLGGWSLEQKTTRS